VGQRILRARHGADGAMWRVRIEYGGQVREQEGDFPTTARSSTHAPVQHVRAGARDFQIGGEHEFRCCESVRHSWR